MSTRSTLNGVPSAVVHSLPALKPLLARTIGAQPAQTLSANRTVLSWSGLYAAIPFTGGSFSAGLKLYSLTVVGVAVSADSAGCSSPGAVLELPLLAGSPAPPPPPPPATGPPPAPCRGPLGAIQSL